MTDGIGRGVAGQLGDLGKDIVSEVVSVPAKLTGFDSGSGTQEKKGSGAGSSKGATASQQSPNKQPSEHVDILGQLAQKDEIEKAKKLAQLRQQLSQQFTKPQSQEDPNQPKNIHEAQQLEELEKQKQEIEEERKKARMTLQDTGSKQKRGNLFGQKVKKQKQFGSEQSKNAVHQ
ncbi:hypothetical protein C4579_03350 [Candidatus Microgenomates bacterium]|nr:MAG: hypothetical protein C4579_03350 [Candidatus Microgenomates bacterium]